MKIIKTIILTVFIHLNAICQSSNNSLIVMEFSEQPNILYRGISNKIKIWKPQSDSIKVINTEINVVKTNELNEYLIDCSNTNNDYMDLFVKSFSNTKSTIDSIRFKIEDIRRPGLKINENFGRYLKMTKLDFKNAKLEIHFPNAEFLKYYSKIIGYKIKVGNNPTMKIDENFITDETYSKIEVGDKIQIFDAVPRLSNFHGCIKKLGGMIIEIINEQ